MSEPKQYLGIMLSSTFKDLEAHRRAVITALGKSGFMQSVMENSGAQAGFDVIDASLQMVRDAAAYIGVISHRYGQTPECGDRNPGGVSITELEFNEAMRLGRPILLFVMSDDHDIKKADIEVDPVKITKLAAFLARAKRMRENSAVHRVYEPFDSLADFSTKAATAIGVLSHLPALARRGPLPPPTEPDNGNSLPRAPKLAALSRYLGSHPFVGRAAELQTLADWCAPADPNPVLLFEAMGGAGKSILTWEWLTTRAVQRTDWAGLFWYSFYEKGAVMATFCRQALAYMSGRPATDFDKLRSQELADRLVAELEKRRWLLVLDGLERVLVAYHRYDAAQLADDAVESSVDQIGQRNVRAAIRPEDDDLLRRLATAAPSKILISTRLTPAVLLSNAGLPVNGVRREPLPGLRPADAEAMFRACRVHGESNAIQAYLQHNCDCHPLVIGALAGLINTYPPDRGDFGRWAADLRHGAALNLGALDLKQRRNHILQAAIDALAPASRALLQTLALLHNGADYETLRALNPHFPERPTKVAEPVEPRSWSFMGEEWLAERRQTYERATVEHGAYIDALKTWENDPVTRAAAGKLDLTITDLELRGLLQYDAAGRRHDLHPVVRGVVTGRMAAGETQTLGRKAVDHLSARSHDPWDKARTLSDLFEGLQTVRLLLHMGNYVQAFSVYRGELSNALFINLNDRREMQSLLRPFFPDGWDGAPVPLDGDDQTLLLNEAAIALEVDDRRQAIRLLERKISLDIARFRSAHLRAGLGNLANILSRANQIAAQARLLQTAFELAEAMGDAEAVFSSRLDLFCAAVQTGDQISADNMWPPIDREPRPRSRALYQAGAAEFFHAFYRFQRQELTEAILAQAEKLARDGQSHAISRYLSSLRGRWHLMRDEPATAAAALQEAVRMAREVGARDWPDEAWLALARLRAGIQNDASGEADLAQGPQTLPLAELWHELGQRERAIATALDVHRWAVADGEPYVHRHLLVRTRTLLSKLGAELPDVPRYDPATSVPYAWEKDVRAFIDKLRAEQSANPRRPS